MLYDQFQVQICDWTGNQWISMFQDQAEFLLGATAADVGKSRDDYASAPTYDEYFRKPLFKTYNFRIRAKMDTFNVSYNNTLPVFLNVGKN